MKLLQTILILFAVEMVIYISWGYTLFSDSGLAGTSRSGARSCS